MVNNQGNYLKMISENNRNRVCTKCFEINKIKNLYCYYCLTYLKKFPNQLSPYYDIGYSSNNNGAIYFYHLDKKESYWYPYNN